MGKEGRSKRWEADRQDNGMATWQKRGLFTVERGFKVIKTDRQQDTNRQTGGKGAKRCGVGGWGGGVDERRPPQM